MPRCRGTKRARIFSFIYLIDARSSEAQANLVLARAHDSQRRYLEAKGNDGPENREKARLIKLKIDELTSGQQLPRESIEDVAKRHLNLPSWYDVVYRLACQPAHIGDLEDFFPTEDGVFPALGAPRAVDAIRRGLEIMLWLASFVNQANEIGIVVDVDRPRPAISRPRNILMASGDRAPDLAHRRSLLTAALGFALLDTRGQPAPPELQTVRTGLGIGSHSSLKNSTEIRQIERFRDVVEGSEGERPPGFRLIRFAADHDHRRLRREFAEDDECFDAAQPRHIDIEQNQVWSMLDEAFDGRRAIGRSADSVSVFNEHVGQQAPNFWIIVNDEDGRRGQRRWVVQGVTGFPGRIEEG